MRTFDLSPMLRASVGFDRMMDLLETAGRVDEVPAYPPYNIEKTGENAYRISMAVAGFGEEDLNITLQENALLVEGKRVGKENGQEPVFLHRGIAERAFQRTFRLADHIRVSGAALENGLLHIDLVREIPEAMKPRSIQIQTTGRRAQPVLENQKAA